MKTKNIITAKRKQDILKLADALGEIIPATGYRSSFNFKSIATKRTYTKKYWKDASNKKTMISEFLMSIYRYHPNILRKIVRNNLPKGIEARHRKGNPVLKSEVENIVKLLKELDINMEKELFSLDLPITRPNIVPPPNEYQQMLKKISLEPEMGEKCKQLFADGHINESVRKAFEIYETKVQEKSGLEDSGKDLMMKAFNENDPLIEIADTSTKRGKSHQEGYRFMAAGSMLFLRNKFSHGDEKQASYIDGFQMLLTANQLLREVNKIK